MNGPTRSSAFERHGPVGTERRGSADFYDELDQFVDSEPAVWGPGQRPATRAGTGETHADLPDSPEDHGVTDDADDSDGAFLRGADRLRHDREAGDARGLRSVRPGSAGRVATEAPDFGADAEPMAGFSTEAGDRRSKFTQRLNDELSRPKARREPAAPAVAPSRPEGLQRTARGPADDERAEPGSGDAGMPAAPPVRRGLHRSPAPSVQAEQRTSTAPAVPDWKRERQTAAAAEEPLDAPAVDSPADALDWELDHAIGQIIGRGQNQAVSTPSAAAVTPSQTPEAADPARSRSAPGAGAQSHDAPPEAPERNPDGPAPADDTGMFSGFVGEDDIPSSTTPAGPDVFEDVPFPAAASDEPVTVPASLAPAAPPRSRATPIATDIPLAAVRSASSRDGGPSSVPAAVPVNLQVDLSGKRVKPIPSFRYERREEQDEPFPAAPPDLDDPLASVFLPDARDALEQRRNASRGSTFAQAGEEDAFDEFDFDDDEADDDELPPSLMHASLATRSRHRGTGRRIPLALGAVVLLALAAGLGFNMFGGTGGTGSDAPPVIRADARDVKSWPEDEESTARPDISERAALGENDRLVVPEPVRISPQQAPPSAAEPVETRSVRTVTVRPDGSIVPTSVPRATRGGAETTSVSSPADESSPDVTDTTTTSFGGQDDETDVDPDLIAGVEAISGDDTAAAMPDTSSDSQSADLSPVDAADDGTFGEVDSTDLASLETQAIPRPRPSPPPRSSRQSLAAANPPAVAAPSAPAAAAPVAPTASASRSPWGVQLASRREQASAEASFRALQQRYPSILGGVAPMIVAANVDDRGTFYRVRVGASSYGEANDLCTRLKNAGADCFVGRN